MHAAVLGDLSFVVLGGSVVGVGVFFTEVVLVEFFRAEEGLKPEAEHVEGGEAGGDEADEPEEFGEGVGAGEDVEENLVFREEAGEGRDAGDGDDAGGHGPEGDRDATSQAAHLAHVLLAGEGVDDGAGGEEEKGLEEGVGEEMEDGGGVGGDPAGEEHVAELGDGGVGEDALDVVLHDADDGGEEGGGRADESDDAEGEGGSGRRGCGSGRRDRCRRSPWSPRG